MDITEACEVLIRILQGFESNSKPLFQSASGLATIPVSLYRGFVSVPLSGLRDIADSKVPEAPNPGPESYK